MESYGTDRVIKNHIHIYNVSIIIKYPMTSIIEIIQYILFLSVGFLIAYQMLWSVLALKGKKIENFKTAKNRKFAVVLLANNGQHIVSKSLYSLSGLVYPKNLYDLIVLAENSTDDFANTARNLGAVVIEVKGNKMQNAQNPLDLIFDKLLSFDKSYEALIIFDANSFVSGNYLEVMNYYLENGNDIIQSSSLVLPNPEKKGNKAACVDFVLNNYVKPLGKKTMGISFVTRNNGICFAFDVFQRRSINAELSYNDVLPDLMWQLKNLQIAFAPEARVFIETPLNNYQELESKNIREHLSKLWKGFYKNPSVRLIDNFLHAVTPSMANIITFILIMCVSNILLWSYAVTGASFIGLWGAMGVLSLLHLSVGLRVAGSNQILYTVFSYWPSHIYAKLSGFFNSKTSPNGEQQLTRNKVTESEDLLSGS